MLPESIKSNDNSSDQIPTVRNLINSIPLFLLPPSLSYSLKLIRQIKSTVANLPAVEKRFKTATRMPPLKNWFKVWELSKTIIHHQQSSNYSRCSLWHHHLQVMPTTTHDNCMLFVQKLEVFFLQLQSHRYSWTRFLLQH